MTPPEISKEKEDALKRQMRQLGIREQDLEERFIRSTGPGGQNINKVATCVQLVHRPTQQQVKCQRSRFQHVNRHYARRLLVEKIKKAQQEQERRRQVQREKERRRRRKRSAAAKEKMLEQKKRRSQKKIQRRQVDLRRGDWG